MKKSRICSLIALCFAVICVFSSCEKAGTELSELMIIQGIGIDSKAGRYTVTVEILNNEQSGSPSGDSNSENKTKIYSAEDATVAAALRKLTSKSGNLPLFAHNRVIILGEEAAKGNVLDILDFFVRNYDSRVSQMLCVAKGGKAEDVIRAKLLNDTVKSEILENMLEESYKQSFVPRARVIDAMNSLENGNSCFCVPAVKVTKNGENEDYQLQGCALFDKKGIRKYIDNEASEGISFLNNTVKRGFLNTRLKSGDNAEVVIVKSRTSYDIESVRGELWYNLTVDVTCDLDEIGENVKKRSDEELVKELKKAVADEVIKKSRMAMAAMQDKSGGDAVRYGKRLQLHNPKEYEKIKDHWHYVFPEIITSMKVNVTIRRVGEETF